ncbi:hypothetical protein BGZ61DRAFT_482351 [Ilyonectria robusta]|uniref:uncharacterized protein n=1 Tax=Ilyonectria robusta TaxID=1079257 RepID=UPI001E8D128A|nr:uncharacterized protein BGZ61DRAFT_482351 [Ilyonectria robusta]KAH8673101.1 hypothetical protein BGZ61DRAFT_482351 [Ilyonectria robusta]
MRPWDESIQGLTQGTARRAAGSPRRLVQHTCADGAVEGSYVGCNSRSRLSMHSKWPNNWFATALQTTRFHVEEPCAPHANAVAAAALRHWMRSCRHHTIRPLRLQSLTGPSEQWASPRNALFPVPSHVHADISPGRRDGLNVGQLPRQQHRIASHRGRRSAARPHLADSPEHPREQIDSRAPAYSVADSPRVFAAAYNLQGYASWARLVENLGGREPETNSLARLCCMSAMAPDSTGAASPGRPAHPHLKVSGAELSYAGTAP